jgi:hypothetical protein
MHGNVVSVNRGNDGKVETPADLDRIDTVVEKCACSSDGSASAIARSQRLPPPSPWRNRNLDSMPWLL